jgi:Tfp pilus assembly protein PilF
MLVLTSALGYFANRTPARVNVAAGPEWLIADLRSRIERFEASLKESPDNFNLLVMLGNSYYQLGQAYADSGNQEASAAGFAGAVEPYGRALAINPQDVNVRVDRAVAAFRSGSLDIAEQEFREAINIDPTHPKAFFNYGVFLHVGRNQPSQAAEQWQRVIELNPPDDQQLVSTARQWLAQVEGAMPAAPPRPRQ